MQKITPCLWFDNETEEAATFYTDIFPNSHISEVVPYTVDTPSNKEIGSVMTVSFELDGYKFLGLNGGPFFKMNPSISFHVKCKTKDEVDALWEKLSPDGKVLMPLNIYPFSERYGWLEDKYGLSWQIILLDERAVNQRFTPVLMFTRDQAGNAEDAINHYVSVFHNASARVLAHYGKNEAPDKEGSVKYATFSIEGQEFGAMDSARKHDFAFTEAISLMIECKDQAEIDYFYEKLSAIPEAEICGWLKDKFGVSWQVVTADFRKFAGKKEVMEALLKMRRIDIAKLKEAYEE